jgi:PAS domain S-box-containing protein
MAGMQNNLSWLSNLRVFQKGLVLVGVPLVLNCAFVGMLFLLVLQADKERQEENRHRKIAENTARVMMLLYDAGYSLHRAFTEMEPSLFAKFKQDLVQFMQTRQELLVLVDQDPSTKAKFHKLTANMDPVRSYLPIVTGMAQHKLSPYKLIPMFAKIRQDVKISSVEMTAGYRQILAESDRYLENSPKKQAALRQLQFAILFGGMLTNISVALLLAQFFMINIVKRLKIMTDNTVRLANEQPLNPPLIGKDEIAELDAVFHRTAEALMLAAKKERSAFDNASDVICVLDSDGRFTRINAACSRLWGHPPERLIGAFLTDFIATEDRESTNQAIRFVQSAAPSTEFENHLQHSDGHLINVLWSVFWSDTESSLFCVAHDITERKQAERMKQEFLAMVSHDLRSPLTSIYGVFQLMSAKAFGELPEMAASKLGMASKNVNRLLTLVNDLLDIEKLEAGQMELERTHTSVAELLKRSGQDVEALAEQKRIDLVIDCTANEFALDLDRMMQVLVNLLSNAIKFSPEGGTVTLTAKSTPSGLEVSVRDQGRGVPATHREAIFERFKQVEAADGKRKSGTGLGLPICKQIVELHGGTIGVESVDGMGSTFWIKIPPQVHELETTRLAALPKINLRERKLPEKQRGPITECDETKPTPRLGRLSLAQKGTILVVVPVVLGLLFVVTLTTVLTRADQETAVERHNRAIALNASRLLNLMYEMGTAMASAKTPAEFERYIVYSRDIPIVKVRLEELTKDNPHLRELVDQIEEVLQAPLEFTARAREVIRQRGLSSFSIGLAFHDHEQLEPIVAQLVPLINELVSEAKKMESFSPQRLADLRLIQGEILLAAVVFSILTSIMLAVFFSRGVTSRLYTLRENTQRLIKDEELNPPLRGSDEIAHLDQVFHSMAQSLRESRQKERAVFDNSQDVICALDDNGVFQQVNPACERMWGFAIEELLNRPVTEILSADDVKLTVQAIESKNRDREPRTFENRVVGKDGSQRYMLWSVSWSASDQLLFCTAHDISKRKELERLKQDFLSMVSHDLRTPLTAIMGVSKLGAVGAFGALPEKATQQLNVVTRNVDRLLNLINDLLDIEKLESGQMQLTIEDIAANSVLERSLQALDNFAEQKQVKLVAEPTDAHIAADADRLIQVMVNLLSNAIKFSPENGTVTLSAVEHPGCVEIRISDQGRGVPDSFKDKIFERYKQVEASDGKRKSGTGLGLPICKQIVLSHGGTIGVESEIGKGSTFWFKIPTSAIS